VTWTIVLVTDDSLQPRGRRTTVIGHYSCETVSTNCSSRDRRLQSPVTKNCVRFIGWPQLCPSPYEVALLQSTFATRWRWQRRWIINCTRRWRHFTFRKNRSIYTVGYCLKTAKKNCWCDNFHIEFCYRTYEITAGSNFISNNRN